MQMDLQNLINMGTKFLGADGMEKIMNGDFSQVEKMGKQLLGGKGEGSELLNNLLKAVPEGTIGRKLGDSQESNENENNLVEDEPSNTEDSSQVA
eukprot:GFUD01055842.1.p1 GENE.GFUD01055842.1~~GFUD01055842.1.p1  ORF type:complete len:111 (-),score=44.15 GFUD01055842.1:138-422(-)